MLPLPASVLSLGAGVIFGLVLGSILVWVGAVAGLVGCLLIGRCAFAPASTALKCCSQHHPASGMPTWRDAALPTATASQRHSAEDMHAPSAFCSFHYCCRLLLRDWVASLAHKYPVWQVGPAKAAVHAPWHLDPHGISRDCPGNTAEFLSHEVWPLDDWSMRLVAARQGAQLWHPVGAGN